MKIAHSFRIVEDRFRLLIKEFQRKNSRVIFDFYFSQAYTVPGSLNKEVEMYSPCHRFIIHYNIITSL